MGAAGAPRALPRARRRLSLPLSFPHCLPLSYTLTLRPSLAEYEAAAPRRPKALRAQQRAGGPAAAAAASPRANSPPPVAPHPPAPHRAGPSLPLRRPCGGGLTNAGLRHPLPDEGWQFGRVLRRSRTAPITHLVGYRHATASVTGQTISNWSNNQ
jgi:hypothetical protein